MPNHAWSAIKLQCSWRVRGLVMFLGLRTSHYGRAYTKFNQPSGWRDMTEEHEDLELDEIRRKGWARYVFVSSLLFAVSGLVLGGFSFILFRDRIPLSLFISIVLAGAVGGATVAFRQWNWHKRRQPSGSDSASKAGSCDAR